MELIPIIRLLWRRKLALALGFALAVAAAVALGGPPPAAGELAWTRVALDTPKSELVQAATSGGDTLAWRASLVAHLMGTDAEDHQLAQRLHVRPYEVTVMDSAFTLPEVPASMPVRAAAVAATSAAPYVLTIGMDNPLLPVISVQAAAPTRDGAVRLAEAAVARLDAQSSLSAARYSSMIKTGGGAALKLQPFSVQQVAPIRVRAQTAKHLPKKPVGAFVLIFGAWLGAVLLLPRIVRRRPRVAPAI
jgi:hypothetical protein